MAQKEVLIKYYDTKGMNLLCMTYDGNGLKIVLSDFLNQEIEILFKYPMDYRNGFDGILLNDYFIFDDSYKGKNIYIVNNSRYLNWFKEMTYDQYLNPTHYRVITDHEVIEIISCEEPLVVEKCKK